MFYLFIYFVFAVTEVRLLLWLWKCRKSDILRRSNFPCRCRLPGLVQTWLPPNIHDTSPSCGAPSLHAARCIVGLNTYPTDGLITVVACDSSIPALRSTTWWALTEIPCLEYKIICFWHSYYPPFSLWYPFSHTASTPEGNLWAEPRWLLYKNW